LIPTEQNRNYRQGIENRHRAVRRQYARVLVVWISVKPTIRAKMHRVENQELTLIFGCLRAAIANASGTDVYPKCNGKMLLNQ